MKNHIRSQRYSAFTLVELLVVTGIIGLLASLLLPALTRAKSAAKTSACLSNLHQIGLGLQMYCDDNEEWLPTCASLPSLATSNLPPITTVLSLQLPSKNVWRCPADQSFFQENQSSYEWNQYLNGASDLSPEDWSDVTRSIVQEIFGGRYKTPLIGDAAAFHGSEGTYSGKNALYFDGRADRGKLK